MAMKGFYRDDYQDLGALPLSQEPLQQTQQKKTPERTGWAKWIPMITGTVGSVGGGIAGGVGGFFGGAGVGSVPGAAIGAGAGGAAGGALGEWLAQKISGEDKDGFDKGNIVQEGAINGVLGAIPIGKVGQVGKGILGIGGKTAAKEALEGAATTAGRELLEEGGEQAVRGGLRGRIGQFLTRKADDTALNAAQLTGKKEALKGFNIRFGEDLGGFLRKNNLIGKSAADIDDLIIAPGQKAYADKVASIGRNISSSDVLAQNEKYLTKLLNSSSTDKQKLGQQVFDELGQIFQKSDALTPKELNIIKSEFQDLARNSYKLGADPSRTGVNKEVAKILQKTLQGVSGDGELKTLGRGIDKGFKAADLIRSAEQNGRGGLSFGLTDLGAAGAGGIIGGGIPGAVMGVAAKKAYNSPTVQSFIANKLAQAGGALTGEAVEQTGKKIIPEAAKTAGKNLMQTQWPGRAIQAMGTAGGEQPVEGEQQPQKFGAWDSAGSDIDAQNIEMLMAMNDGLIDQQGNPVDNSMKYTREDMMKDIQRDPQNAKQYQSMYAMMAEEDMARQKMMMDAKGGGEASYNKPTASQYSQATSAMSSIDQLEQMLSNNPGIVNKNATPGQGVPVVGGVVSRAAGTGEYRTLTKNILNSVARINTGANMPESEQRFYEQTYLPQPGDSDQTKAQKIMTLRQFFSPIVNYNGGGGSDIESLMSMF